MLIVDKIAQALSVIDYPAYAEWLAAHEYADNLESKQRWQECKAYKKAMLSCFTVTELKELFSLTHNADV